VEVSLLPQFLHESERAHHRDLCGLRKLRDIAVVATRRGEQVLG
jgi:hypothetical protein